MKVMQVISSFGIGGAEVMCECLSRKLKEKGEDVVVVSLYSKKTNLTESLERTGIKVYYLNKHPSVDFKIVFSLSKIIKKENPDVIHAHLDALKYVGLAKKKRKIKLIYTVHSLAEEDARGLTRKIYRKLFKKRVMPIALSYKIQKSITRIYKINESKVPIVFNGSDLSKCIEKNDWTFKDKEIRILHVGSFKHAKNHFGLIESFQIYHRTYQNSRLILIGDGELKNETEKKVEEYGLESYVDFLGVQKNVFPFLSEADIFVLPSLYEGMPISLIEAMGTGMPIVATSVGGIPDMLKNEESAILVCVDPKEVANALEIVSNDSVLREKLGRNAKKQACKFSAETMVEEYMKIYR